MSALDLFFRAKSFAIVGASNHPLKVGHQILRNLLQTETAEGIKKTPFKLYPINPTSKAILGLPVYASLSAIKDPVDVVVIATPAPTVNSIVDELLIRNQKMSAKDRVKGVVMITAGFAEVGEAGKNIQHVIATKLQLAGVELLGPNTLGLLDPLKQMNASFAQREIYPGNLGIISQSGAILTAMFDALNNRQHGISFAVSLGNKAGITENDCLEYTLDDPHTDVVLLYLESFYDLPKFFELVSKVRQKKPVIVLKGGTSQRGQQASASHTAALATNQVLLAAAAQQIGFTLVETLEDFIQAAFFFAQYSTVPQNVMVITNAGGPGVNTVDELQNHQVSLAQWSTRAVSDLSDSLPNIPPHNPLDLLGDANPERFAQALKIAQHDVNVDSVLFIVTPQAVTDMSGIVQQMIAHRGKKPLFVSLVGGDHLDSLRKKLRENKILANDFPNESVEMIALMQRICRHQYTGQLYKPLVGKAQASGKPPVVPPSLAETFHLLSHYGFDLPGYHIITPHNKDAIHKLPYPLFVKTANLSLLHKKEIGAVFGTVHSAEEGTKAYVQLQKFGSEVLFQELVQIDHEILLGVEKDTQFGWYMTVGMGGSYTNLLGDRQYAFLTATKTQLKTAWMQTKASEALKKQPDAQEKVVECMVALQKLIQENPWIRSLEINPLVINSTGVWAADVKIQV